MGCRLLPSGMTYTQYPCWIIHSLKIHKWISICLYPCVYIHEPWMSILVFLMNRFFGMDITMDITGYPCVYPWTMDAHSCLFFNERIFRHGYYHRHSWILHPRCRDFNAPACTSSSEVCFILLHLCVIPLIKLRLNNYNKRTLTM